MPTDTEIRNTFQNLRRMLAERLGEPTYFSWASLTVLHVDDAMRDFELAVGQHITAESLGDHS